MTYFTTFASPIGDLTLAGSGGAVTGLYFSTGPKAQTAHPTWQRDESKLAEEVAQLRAYFAGGLQSFDLPLRPQATPFQSRVLTALRTIPYGELRSYKDIAEAVGEPNGARAVGTANGNNPIAIIIPCHRVVGSNGALTGFGGGLAIKRFLLDLESRNAGFRLSN